MELPFPAAVGAALFYDPADMEKGEITRLGMEAVALTHGDPMAFLPGAAVTELVTAALLKPTQPLQEQIEGAMADFTARFDPEYHRYISQINNLVKMAVSMSRDPKIAPMEAMERLQCRTGAQVLAVDGNGISLRHNTSSFLYRYCIGGVRPRPAIIVYAFSS